MPASESMISAVWNDISAVRETAPMVLNITNYVVTNNTANALLALGASPAMSHPVDDLPACWTCPVRSSSIWARFSRITSKACTLPWPGRGAGQAHRARPRGRRS